MTFSDRHQPRCHQPIRGQTQGRRKEPKRDNPLPEAAHRPTDLPAHHRPAPNPELRPATHPPPTSQHHYHPDRPSHRNPPGPYLRTRTRTQPQPPASNPIPEVAPHPRASPTADLTTIGASPGNLVRFTLPAFNPLRCREATDQDQAFTPPSNNRYSLLQREELA